MFAALIVTEAVRGALPAGPGHPAHPVDEELALGGEVIVDHVVQQRDVDTAGSQVRHQHHVHFPGQKNIF